MKVDYWEWITMHTIKNCHIVNFGQGIGAVKIARLITYKLASFNV